eukprot:966777-Prorocentrum_minimum.AAC.2
MVVGALGIRSGVLSVHPRRYWRRRTPAPLGGAQIVAAVEVDVGVVGSVPVELGREGGEHDRVVKGAAGVADVHVAHAHHRARPLRGAIPNAARQRGQRPGPIRARRVDQQARAARHVDQQAYATRGGSKRHNGPADKRSKK